MEEPQPRLCPVAGPLVVSSRAFPHGHLLGLPSSASVGSAAGPNLPATKPWIVRSAIITWISGAVAQAKAVIANVVALKTRYRPMPRNLMRGPEVTIPAKLAMV
jgi:hypothetical protein